MIATFVRSKFSRDAIALGSATVLARALTAIWFVLLVRGLGPESFGLFSVLWSAILIAVSFSDLGLTLIVTRRVAANGLAAEAPFVRASLTIQILASGLAAALLSLIAGLWLGASTWTCLGLFLAVLAGTATPLAKGLLRGSGRIPQEAVLMLIMSATLLGSTLVLFRWSQSVDAAVFAFAASQLVVGLLSVRMALRSSGDALEVHRGGRTAELWDSFKSSLPFNIMGTASVVYLQVDVFALEWASTPEQVGLYAASAQIYQATWIIPVVLASAALPRLSRGSGPGSGVSRYAHRYLFASTLLGLCVGMAIFLGSPLIVEVFLGPNFDASSGLLRILSVGIPFVFLNLALGNILIATHRERRTMANAVILAIISIILFPIAAVVWGAVGVAAVVVGLQGVACVNQSLGLR